MFELFQYTAWRLFPCVGGKFIQLSVSRQRENVARAIILGSAPFPRSLNLLRFLSHRPGRGLTFTTFRELVKPRKTVTSDSSGSVEVSGMATASCTPIPSLSLSLILASSRRKLLCLLMWPSGSDVSIFAYSLDENSYTPAFT